MKDDKNGAKVMANLIKPGAAGYGIKILIVLAMILFFLIPLGMVKDLVREREHRKYEAEAGVFASWGGDTALGGPLLIIPRTLSREILDEKGKFLRMENYRDTVYLLPRNLKVSVESSSSVKSRGIFDVPVFIMSLEGQGDFALEALYKKVDPSTLHWDEARLLFSYPGLKGLVEAPPLQWDGEERNFEADGSHSALYSGTLSVPVDLGGGDIQNISRTIPFRFTQKIRGGRSLEFLPLGADTLVQIKSDWPSPSFKGYYLPTERHLNEDGFTAEWQSNSLSRSIPELWTGSQMGVFDDIRETAFGLDFYPLFDSYQKSRRTVQYGILFLLIPFLTFFLFEVIRKVKIHPVQYILAGGGNILFYLILLSLSEHISFAPSYLTAAVAVTLLLTLYTLSIRGVGRKGLYLAPVMAAGYGYLYFVLKSEDYALIMGTGGLFAALALTMYLTRGIDWYREKGE